MSTTRKLIPTLLGVSLLGTLPSVISYAQDAANDEDIFELSPFQVDGSKDDGYRATSTTAGSRLNTELKDVAASVTVLTDAFLDDLGAYDIATGLSMVAGVETEITTDQTSPSLSQGYLGGDFGDRNTSEGSVRVRGLGNATNASNFIEVRGSLDRYNVSRVEFLRGPNSILFGLGQPAGLVNYTTKRASTNRNINEVQLGVDNFGSLRSVVDISRVLIEDKLAARVVTKSSNEKYMFDNAFQRDDRLFLTATYKPFENTTLVGYYENVNSHGRRPNYRLVQDNVSGWLDLWNQAQGTLTPEQIANNFYWNPYTSMTSGGDAPVSPNLTFIGRDGVAFTPDIRNDLDGLDTALTPYYDSANWSLPIDGLITRTGSRTTSGAQPSNASNVRAQTSFHRSSDPLEDVNAGYVDRQAVDQGIFPWKDIDLGSLPGNFRDNDNEKLFFSIEQKVNKDLYLSASFQSEEDYYEQVFSPIAQQQSISLDINTHLLDGRENPNFLRPFIYGRAIASATSEKADSMLLQANYDLDFAEKTDSLGWLGKHRVTGFYSSNKEDRAYHRYGYMAQGDIPGVMTSAVDNSARHVYPIFYVGDAVRPGDTSLRFTGFPESTTPYVDQAYPYLYYTNESSARGDWRISSSPLELAKTTFTNSPERTTLNASGYGASLQSFFWRNRIVTTFGWREDTVDQYSWQRVLDSNNVVIGDGTDRSHFFRPDAPTLSLSEPTITKGVVYHITDWVRVFGTESENFDLTTPRADNFFRPITPQSGVTEEYGIGFMLLENKLDIKFTAYETSQKYQNVGTSIARNRIPAFENLVLNALEAAGRAQEYYAVVGYDANGPILRQATVGVDEFGAQVADGQYEAPNDVASTQDSISEGWEASFTYNPTRNWRFQGSLSKLENAVANRQQEVLQYIDYRSEFWGKLFAEGLHTGGDNNSTVYLPGETVPGDDSLLSTRFLSTMGNELLDDLQNDGLPVQGLSKYNARVTANYSFREGFLDGFSVGTNLRWESGKVIGNQLKAATTSLGGLNNIPTQIVDNDNAFEGGQIVTGGMMANYRTKVFSDKVDWRIQLNVNNLFKQGDDLRIISVRPDGSPIYGINNPTTFQLTNTFKF